MRKFLEAIPRFLSSTPMIFTYLFILFYLIIFGIVGLFVEELAPDDRVHAVIGSYLGLISALGAAIAAGASTATHRQVKRLHDRHTDMQNSINRLRDKIDKLSKK